MELISYANISPARLDATFAALADATCRAILARLAVGEASVAELAEPFAMSQPAISKHLKVRAGLISQAVSAQRGPRKLQATPLAEANNCCFCASGSGARVLSAPAPLPPEWGRLGVSADGGFRRRVRGGVLLYEIGEFFLNRYLAVAVSVCGIGRSAGERRTCAACAPHAA